MLIRKSCSVSRPLLYGLFDKLEMGGGGPCKEPDLRAEFHPTNCSCVVPSMQRQGCHLKHRSSHSSNSQSKKERELLEMTAPGLLSHHESGAPQFPSKRCLYCEGPDRRRHFSRLISPISSKSSCEFLLKQNYLLEPTLESRCPF